MSLVLSLFPDFEDLDVLIGNWETMLAVYVAVLGILLAFVVAGGCIDRARRSPVDKLLRRRLG